MLRSKTLPPTLPLDVVGLSRNRPFRFCTRQTGSVINWARYPGDEPDPGGPEMEHAYTVSVSVTSTSMHQHAFYEIVLVQQGTATHLDLQGERPLKRGDVVLVMPSGAHGYKDGQDFRYTNIYLKPDWLLDDLQGLWSEKGLVRLLLADALFHQSTLDGLVSFRLREEEMASCEAEFSTLAEEAQKSQPSLLLYNGCFLKILSALNGAYMRTALVPDLGLRREVWQAARWMEQRIGEGRALDAVALACHVGKNRHRLSELFHEGTGMSVQEYYRARRLQLAVRSLTEPSVSITETAYRFGFTDASHFSRTFRKHFGLSPSAYRAACRVGEGGII